MNTQRKRFVRFLALVFALNLALALPSAISAEQSPEPDNGTCNTCVDGSGEAYGCCVNCEWWQNCNCNVRFECM